MKRLVNLTAATSASILFPNAVADSLGTIKLCNLSSFKMLNMIFCKNMVNI